MYVTLKCEIISVFYLHKNPHENERDKVNAVKILQT